MLTPPADLDSDRLRTTLQVGWEFAATTLSYQPVGFGSHHWLATSARGARLFVTVDDLPAKLIDAHDSTDSAYARLSSAFDAALSLSSQTGLSFVLAPLPGKQGQVLQRLQDRYSMVVHPYVAGREAGADGQFQSADDLRAIVKLLVDLHGASCEPVRTDDFAIPARDELERLLDMVNSRWDSGPYAGRARKLLQAHAAGVARLLTAYDRMAARVVARPERMVVTHGEPNASNVLLTTEGMLLVDWESVLLAPPERDLWSLSEQNASVLAWYAAATGVKLDQVALSTYRLWYDLFEIGGYLRLFHAQHTECADTAESWRNLVHFLRPAERWPQLVS